MQRLILTSILLMTTFSSHAFSIDKMLLIAGEDGNGVFTLTSSKSQPEYIKGGVSQVKVENGELDRVELTKDNLPLWDLALLPNKIILNPGERRRVSVKNLCQANCDNLKKDKVYQVTFMPSIIDGDKKESRIGINYGYAPYYIVPAKVSNVDYKVKYSGSEVYVENNGNTFFYIQFDNCKPNSVSQKCKQTNTILSGRKKAIKLAEGLQNVDSLSVKVANHDYSYNRSFTIKKK
ncbi:hypothetical protein BCU30_017105 [Vibrio lentus]|uniref:hypothetical protein n=1 Tax=Vibrio lentus TaxID=136468 RepID=UPI000CC8D13E|nr:hypothetical protein [Vibrio lentus]PMH13354.1 hypothetical protein BCU76_20975 [Vibrio lentus]PMI64188.1 hypothetical protein BCU40_03590 [Vibrio lentus]PMJ13396.1 hypothetical protein BCU30_13890 [Vibrio lentus]PMN07684.1 hypothetical protein BCT42_01180 [Vibrio lentus]PMN53552.1 hypothetical protein BCT31_12305 [Vibrio lentus]